MGKETFLSRKQLQLAQELGGTENPDLYRQRPDPHYSENPHHLLRNSRNNDDPETNWRSRIMPNTRSK